MRARRREATREDAGSRGASSGASPQVRTADRLVSVDAVRAIALFGVLVMNLRTMAGLDFLTGTQREIIQTRFDLWLDAGLQVLVDKKALSAFSFLFGLSFSLVLDGARRRGRPVLAPFARRLGALALFGVLNLAFLFWGDILITYACLGLLLPLAARLPQGAILALSGLLLIGMPVLLAVLGQARDADVETAGDVAALATFGGPSYLAAAAYGIERYLGAADAHSPAADLNYLNILGLFLLGLWAGRARIPHDVGAHRALLLRTAIVALPTGLAASLALWLLPPTAPSSTLALVGRPIVAVGYLALALLVLEHPRGRGAREFLAPVGRVALTNYLAFGLAGQILYYGWAFGMMGRVGTATVLATAVLVYAVVLFASRAWLKHYRYGPAEWAWRTATTLKVPPLRR